MIEHDGIPSWETDKVLADPGEKVEDQGLNILCPNLDVAGILKCVFSQKTITMAAGVIDPRYHGLELSEEFGMGILPTTTVVLEDGDWSRWKLDWLGLRHNSRQELDDKDEEDGDGNGVNQEFFVDVYWIARKEQDLIDQIIHGKLAGQRPSMQFELSPRSFGGRIDLLMIESSMREKQWLLSRIGLIVDCDDDVMDDSESQMRQPVLDHENMIEINIDFKIEPDLIVLLNMFREICDEKGFKEQLESALERIEDIKSQGRTRELIWKSGKVRDGAEHSWVLCAAKIFVGSVRGLEKRMEEQRIQDKEDKGLPEKEAEQWSRTEEQRIAESSSTALKINKNNKKKDSKNNKKKKKKKKKKENNNNIKEQLQPTILRADRCELYPSGDQRGPVTQKSPETE
ncbi:hypothetical protein BY996DRAFT_6508245 [Phakopsora pachyrhizi]|nr:hypothetical protein BY996DRAFT_6508245 [Phakopsora pachyrhizi]